MSRGPVTTIPRFAGRKPGGLVRMRDLTALRDYVAGLPARPGAGIRFLAGPNGTVIHATGAERVRQLQIAGNPAGTAVVNYGEASGLGASGVISGMTEGELNEYSSTTGLDFYLKFTFEPNSEVRAVSDGNGGTENIYVLGNGGSDGSVEIVTRTAGTAAPNDTNPTVNSTTGAAAVNGVYHLKFGSLTTTNGPLNSLYGPVGFSFCAPDSLKVWEMSPSF